MNLLKAYFKKLFKIMNKDEMKILPGHLAYFLVLSIIPTVTLIGVICNLVGLSTNDIISFLEEIVPKGVSDLIEPFIESSIKGSTIIYFIIGFILVSNGAFAIILASNSLYKVEDANYLLGRIKALFLTILLVFLFVFILTVLAFGNMILKFILSLKLFSDVSDTFYHIFVYLKWPVAFLIIYIILKLIYTIAPDKKIKSKTVTKGSIFTTVSWLFITAIYSYYANNIARYDLFYGNLSNIIILMMWIYMVAYIFAIGIAINVNRYNYLEENSTNKK